MGRAIVAGGKPAMEAPVTGIVLADIAEGSLVKINENGSPVEFYVAKHNYESGLNGAGRTLLVRKDVHSNRAWGGNYGQANFVGSAIYNWLNGDYKSMLDSEAQNQIGSTKFYAKEPYNGLVTSISAPVFILSVDEVGRSGSTQFGDPSDEGSVLPISSLLSPAYMNGAAAEYWTRSRNPKNNTHVFRIRTDGSFYVATADKSYGARPCFTLPNNVLFDIKTLIFKGV